MLLPLWRTSETYMALSDARNRCERVHHHWRQRYRVALDDHMLRPKRPDLKRPGQTPGRFVVLRGPALYRRRWNGAWNGNDRPGERSFCLHFR